MYIAVKYNTLLVIIKHGDRFNFGQPLNSHGVLCQFCTEKWMLDIEKAANIDIIVSLDIIYVKSIF